MAENVTRTSPGHRLPTGAAAVVHRGPRAVIAAEPAPAPPKPDSRPKPAPPRSTPPPKPTAAPPPAASAKPTSAATPKSAGAATPASVRRNMPSRKPAAAGPPAKASAPNAAGNGEGATLVVRPDEKPWTAAELADVRSELDAEVLRHEEEITESERDLAELLRDSGEGAGEDQADSGTKTFEREHEMSLANNSRDMLLQSFRARARMDDGTYGICETCGQPVGKARLQAFPRATLCVRCKQREERR